MKPATLCREFASALMLLTRLPAAWLLRHNPPEPLRSCIWAFVPVGILIGACGGGVFWVCAKIGLPRDVTAIFTIAAQIMLCGGLHEDGLADFFDGLGGRTQERRLEIMRDSRIGSFGALSLLLGIGLKIAALANYPTPAYAFAALIAAGAGARAAMIFIILVLHPVRQDGLAHELQDRKMMPGIIAIAVAGLATWLLLPHHIAAITICGACLVALLMARHLHRTLGGYTGDTLGATEALAEILMLALASIR